MNPEKIFEMTPERRDQHDAVTGFINALIDGDKAVRMLFRKPLETPCLKSRSLASPSDSEEGNLK